ncbi:unnamed protein product [Ambrosiozyma monospora]|uniref:Unnamed protein product n=1 Tax=Ambrosiozyma monospora TaxID=43982 RepID=A0ACB5TBR7_AMBMO|nr:unnamed protein product [Ambrosiozyma monospora]
MFGQIHYAPVGQPVGSFSLPSPLSLVDSSPNSGYFGGHACNGSQDVNDSDDLKSTSYLPPPPPPSSDYPSTAVFFVPEFGVIMGPPTNPNSVTYENTEAVLENLVQYYPEPAPGLFSVIPNPNNARTNPNHPNTPVDPEPIDTNEESNASNLNIDYFHYRDQHRGYQLVHHESDPDEGSNVSKYSISSESMNISTGAMRDEDCMFVNFPHSRITDDNDEDLALITASSLINETVDNTDSSIDCDQRSPNSAGNQELGWSAEIENTIPDASLDQKLTSLSLDE